MVHFNALRGLIGPQRFDDALSKFRTTNPPENPIISALETMEVEPANHGLSVEEGRAALERASERKYELPKVDK